MCCANHNLGSTSIEKKSLKFQLWPKFSRPLSLSKKAITDKNICISYLIIKGEEANLYTFIEQLVFYQLRYTYFGNKYQYLNIILLGGNFPTLLFFLPHLLVFFIILLLLWSQQIFNFWTPKTLKWFNLIIFLASSQVWQSCGTLCWCWLGFQLGSFYITKF